MAYEIGTAYIQIVPSFDHIQRELERGAKKIADDLGAAAEKSVPEALAKSVREGVKRAEKEAESGGKDVGKALAASTGDAAKQSEKAHADAGKANAQAYADRFEEEFKRRLTTAFKQLPRAVLGEGDPTGEHLEMVKLRAEVKRVRDTKFDVGDAGDTQAIAEARRLRDLLLNAEQNTGSRQFRVDLSAGRREIEQFLAIVENRMGAFQRKVTSDVGRAAKQLSTLDAHRLNDRARDEVNELRKELLDLSGQRIGLDLDDSKFLERLGKVRKRLEEVAKTGETAELRWNADQALQAVDDAFQATMTSVEKARLEAEAKQKRLDDAEAERQRVRSERLADLEDARLKRTADQEVLLAKKVEAAEDARLKRKGDQEELLRQKQVEFDRRQERLQQERIEREAEQAAKKLAEKLQREADEAFGKTFAGKIAKQLEDAFKSLPDIGTRPARTASEQQIKDLRAELEALSGKRIGVDIDATEATARVRQIREELARLAATSPDVKIHVDSLEAAAKLAEVERMAKRLDHKQIDLRLDGKDIARIGDEASVSLSRLEALVAGGLSLGTGLVPVAAAAAASIGFIATAAGAATAGVGVLALGFSGIGTAVQALNKYQQDAQKSTVTLAAAQDRVASATESVASANRSLANTRASAAEAARRAAQQVADAERAVRDARDDAARAVRDAVEREQDAQRSLTRVNIDAREAREALTRSYRDAAKALADLDSQIKSNALDQREATLQVKKAKEELDEFLANPRATEAEREQARITYERQVQQIKDLQRRGKELAEQQAEASRKGLAGSDQVVAARKRVADADERVADAQRALAKAREGVVRAQLDGERKVSDAQRRVADAQRSQAEQQRQSAFSIAQAQQSVISAQRSLSQAIEKTSVAGGEAFQNLKTAMQNLSPAGQEFAKFIFSLKPAFDQLRATAAQGVLPGVQDAFESALPYLPAFTEWTGKVAQAIGLLFTKAGQFLSTNATWQDFFTYIGDTAVPTLQQLSRIGSDLATGLVDLLLAFRPFNEDFGAGLEGLAQRFATWASALQANTSFQSFMAYVKDNAPAVVDLLSELVTFVERFVAAAAPIGAVVLKAFTGFVHVLNLLPVSVLSVVLGLIGGIAALMLTFSSAQRAAVLVGGTFSKVTERTRDSVFYLRYGLSSLRDQFVATTAAQQASIGTMQQSSAAMAASAAETARMRASMMALNPAASRTQVAFANAGASAAELRSRLLSSGTATRALGTALGGLKTAGGLARQAFSGLVGALGGPVGIAIAGATIAATVFAAKAEEQEQKVNNLTQALHLLGKAYRETKDISSTAVQDVVNNSQELQDLINKSYEYGIALEDVAKAADGQADAQQRLLAALRAQVAVIEAARKAEFESGDPDTDRLVKLDKQQRAIEVNIDALQNQFTQLNNTKRATDALNAAQEASLANGPKLTEAQRAINDKLAEYGERISYLKGLLRLYGEEQLTAAQKADILRDAIDQATKSKISAIEAEERQARTQAALKDSIESNRQSLQAEVVAGKISAETADKRSKSLSVNTEEGRKNRDALEDAAQAVRDRYIADVESGIPMEEATKRHKERIDALIQEAAKQGLDEKKARELIAAYGDIPPEVKTAYSTKGYQQIYEELQNLQIAQLALEQGLTPDEAAKEFRKQHNKAQKGDYTGTGGLKDGGPVAGQPLGPGGPTSDDVPIWASLGEYMQPAATVDYYGVGFMEALRRRLIPKDVLPGFAHGGLIGSKMPRYAKGGRIQEWPFEVDVSQAFVPTKDEALAVILKKMGGGAGSSGGIGSADMMKLLHAVFPGLPMYSGYRPGSRTASGSLSYHALIAADGDKGRAVDLPPRQDVFDFIHDNFFSATRELIWLGDKYRNIWNGRHHKFSDSLLANHGTAGMRNAHLHWAYDQGGYLPPGFTTVYNGTGRPEPVFTDGQWSQISALLADKQRDWGGRGEVHNHFDFANSTLDEARLNAIQQRQDALSRLDRPNW